MESEKVTEDLESSSEEEEPAAATVSAVSYTHLTLPTKA